jgi:sulfite exporter TauE/SafE
LGGGERKLAALRPAFLYNLGRVTSYTTIGFVVGALGSALSFSNAFQGALKLIAGVFMVLMGVNMLGIFPVLRKFAPRMPRRFARKINEERGKSNSPLIVGLLNGFMPCGPLQAMQIYALSAGSAVAGAFSMFLFSLGTVPLMFGLGALSAILSARFTKRVTTVGAVLVAVLGLSMLSQGWNLTGYGLPGGASGRPDIYAAEGIAVVDGVQLIGSTLSPGEYPAITVFAGMPVKWTIDAPRGSINGCNNRMFISEYGIEYSFKTGENVIEFTPADAKTVRYSCWMGMIRGTINVVPANEAETAARETPVYAPEYFKTGASCR